MESCVRLLSRLDEAVERGVERNVDAAARGLAYEGAGDQVDLGGPTGFDVLEHRGIVGGASPGREDVHLPGIVVQLDPCGLRDRLALVDEGVDEVAEIGRLGL